MNVIAVIILIILLFEFALGLVSNLLNLKSLKMELPETLSDVYEPKEYRRSQEYTRSKTYFDLLSGAFQLLVFLVFWLLGGFNLLDTFARGIVEHPIATGLIYIGVLMLLHTLLSLPFSIYATFVIEEQFGFNKTTPKTFVLDIVKGTGLLVVLGCPLLAAVLGFFEYAGGMAWIYVWGSVTLFSLTMAFIAPSWIMPLFNKFTPMEPGDLKDSIFGYAKSVDFTISNILVMDGSKRSNKANAFFTGFGKNKRIALFDTLIEKHTITEIVAVVAHEIGHYKKRHIPIGILIGVCSTGVLFFFLSLILDTSQLYDAFGMEKQSIYSGLVFFGFLYTPVELVLSAGRMAISRYHEYQADLWSIQTTGDPTSLVDGLKRLSADSLSNLTPHPLQVFLNASHPPLLQRISAMQKHTV